MKRKAALRNTMRMLRKEQIAEHALRHSRTICERLLELDQYEAASHIGIYIAMDGEVDLSRFMAHAFTSKKQLYAPCLDESSGVYRFASIDSASILSPGRFGIHEPSVKNILPVEALHLMIAPGMAFDFEGNRLGRGGGCYDRLLQRFEGCSAGVGYGFQIVESVPDDPWDMPLDLVVSEKGIIKVKKE